MPKTKTRTKTRTKNKSAKKPDYRYSEVTDKLITLLEKEQKPWVKPWSSTPYSNLISKHIYSGGNPLLLQIDTMLHEDWTSPYFVGFQQAKNLGWNVKKGSKATHILYAGTRKITTEKDGCPTSRILALHIRTTVHCCMSLLTEQVIHLG